MLATSKKDIVKKHFEESKIYLRDNHIIRYRAEIIDQLLKDKSFNNIIDIACGNAQISLQFLNSKNHITLVDISESMLNEAKKNIPSGLEKNVSIIQGDIEHYDITSSSFDLVICTGLLAHVNNPLLTIQNLQTLVKENGCLILQNTNGSHPYTWLNMIYRKFIGLFSQNIYMHNKISHQTIKSELFKGGFIIKEKFNYVSSFMFVSKLLSGKAKYLLNLFFFGKPHKKRMQFFGNESIYLFLKQNDI